LSDLPAEVSRWRTSPLNAEHLTGFLQSGRPEIDTWFNGQALRLQDDGVCRTYVWGDQLPYVAGFYALVPHTLQSDEDLNVTGHAGGVLSGYLIAKLGLHAGVRDLESLLPGDSDQRIANKYLLVVDAVARASRASYFAGGRYVFIDLRGEPEWLVEVVGRVGFRSISSSGSPIHVMLVRRPKDAAH
jgi:hypothetical protein